MQNMFTGPIVTAGAASGLWSVVVGLLRRRRAVSKIGPLSAFAMALGLLLLPIPTLAHHGQAEWDNTKSLTLKGTVTKFNWVNPHVTIEWDVKDTNGETVHWIAELSSPGNIGREGWHHDSLKPGDEVTVYCHPAKNGRPVANVQRVEFADGRPPLGGGGAQSPEGGAR